MMTSEAELRRPFDQMEAQCRQLCAASRARQCWLEHQAEWDLASSQGSGYSSYKSLSRAYLAQ